MNLSLSERTVHVALAVRGGLLPARPAFDALFVFGTLALALSFGAVASFSTAALVAVVWVDVWLLPIRTWWRPSPALARTQAM